MNHKYSLKIKHTVKGRVIQADPDGTIYIGQKYDVRAYRGDVNNMPIVAQVPCPWKRKLIEPFRPLCRLFRHEIRGFGIFPDGSTVVAPRQGLFYGNPGEVALHHAALPHATPAIRPPTNLTVDSNGRVLWGEYLAIQKGGREVRLCASQDKGKNYDVVFTFEHGDIGHVHRIQEDPYEDCYWVLVGDHGPHPGFLRLSKDFKTADWLVRGEQKYRAVTAIILKDRIVYGTDSEKEPNGIYSLDKKTGKAEKLCDTPGSSCFASKFGKWFAISTGVEYFEKWENNLATLWISEDADNWQKVFDAPKDFWSIKYFIYGGFNLPTGQSPNDEIVFSGQSVKKYDNLVCISEITTDDSTGPA